MPKLNRRPKTIEQNRDNQKDELKEEDKQNDPSLNKGKWHWDIITSFGPSTCFVCDKRIKSSGVCVGKHAINGQRIYRHAKCCSGSENWEKKFHGYVDPHMRKINEKEG